MNAFRSHYRIVADRWSGFEVQVWRWWWPFWAMPACNTHPSAECAEAWANKFATHGIEIKNLGALP